MKAFLAALLLFAVTVLGCHLYIQNQGVNDSASFALAPSEEKGKLRAALTENMPKDGYPVFGSSEFMHGADTIYHPANVFAQTDFHPMLIGAGYYQSLSHAVTLASIEESMQVRKAVLILSPQWFRKTGVVDQAYASRFTETHYAAAMGNEKLSDETKQYISDRTQKLLKVDEKTRVRVLRYDEVRWKQEGGPLAELREEAWSAFLYEKELFETMLLGKSLKRQEKRRAETASEVPLVLEGAEDASAIPESFEPLGDESAVPRVTESFESESVVPELSDPFESTPAISETFELTENELLRAETSEPSGSASYVPDWSALYELAEKEGEEQNQNEFFIDDAAYKRLVPHLPKKKGVSSDAVKGYQTGPEFDDLRCFLTVCRELGVEPMIVVVPVNGYYYDYTGFPKEARQAYYAKVKGIAEEYGAKVADFSDQEYTKYFFEDRVHLGKKGWLMVNESLYEFYKEA